MLSRSHDSTVDLDLELRQAQEKDNPVYYVQYAPRAHRLDPAPGGRGARRAALGAGSGAELHPAERELIKKLLAFPGEVAEAAERRAPHRIAAYALELVAGVRGVLPRLPGARRRAPTPCARCGSARCARPRRSSPGRWACWGSRRRTRCDAALVERLLALERGRGRSRSRSGSGSKVSPTGASPGVLARAPPAPARRRRGSSPRRPGVRHRPAERVGDDLRPRGRVRRARRRWRRSCGRPAGRRRVSAKRSATASSPARSRSSGVVAAVRPSIAAPARVAPARAALAGEQRQHGQPVAVGRHRRDLRARPPRAPAAA